MSVLYLSVRSFHEVVNLSILLRIVVVSACYHFVPEIIFRQMARIMRAYNNFLYINISIKDETHPVITYISSAKLLTEAKKSFNKTH